VPSMHETGPEGHYTVKHKLKKYDLKGLFCPSCKASVAETPMLWRIWWIQVVGGHRLSPLVQWLIELHWYRMLVMHNGSGVQMLGGKA